MALMHPDARKPLTPLLIGLLLVLLPLLAVLQYRWLTEVSEGEQMQMKAHLHAAAEQFTRGFDRELTRAFLIFQPPPQAARPDAGAALAASTASAWKLWQTTAPDPELVQAAILVQPDASGHLTLLQFMPRQQRFVPVQGSRELAAWRDRLQQAWQADGRTPPLAALLSASDPASIPAIPILFGGWPGAHPPGSGERRPPPLPPAGRPGFRNRRFWPVHSRILLVELNRHWLEQTFLPRLAAQAFAPAGERDYHVSIRDVSTPARVMFDWGPAPDRTATPPQPDMVMPLFRVRMADFIAVWAPRLSKNSVIRRPPPATVSDSRPYPAHRWALHFAGPPPPGKERSFQFFVSPPNHPGLWMLEVRHRAGSLAEAVARIRRRNLAVSGGILLLLLASIALLFRLVRSSQRLAEQQMEFVAGVSHELRTPLAVIGSAASNLADGVVGDPAQVRRYGHLIASEGRRLNGMVEQILEFSALQVRRQPLQTQPVAIGALLATIVQSAEPGLGEKGIRLECDIPANLPEVEADPAALRRCLDNLIGNAAKYAADAGWIGLHIDFDSPELRITVADRGPGIEIRDLPHLFEPFYRGRLALDRQIHGNGLGLSLVQRLMRAQGGHVSVRTQPGQGAAFTLHLRLAQPRPIPAEVPSQA